MIGNNNKSVLIGYIDNDHYIDPQSKSSFTITKFRTLDNVSKKFASGAISLSQTEDLVVEPDFKQEMSFSKTYKRVRSDKRSEHKLIDLDINAFRQHLIKRRQADTQGPTNNYVELKVFSDYYHFVQAKNLLNARNLPNDDQSVAKYLSAYLSTVINLANQMYEQSLAKVPQLKISIGIKSIHIFSDRDASYFSTSPENYILIDGKSNDDKGRQFVDSSKFLDSFNKWLVEAGYAKLIVKDYDEALIYTGSNLRSSNSDDLGIAPTFGICRSGRNGFLVEDSGDFSSDTTTAHELGHALGLKHDPDYGCPDENNFIMSTSNQPSNAQNSRFFSSCSIENLIKNIITDNKLKCLSNSISPINTLTPVTYPGQILSLNEQCQIKFNNPKIFAKAGFNGQKYEQVCETLYCSDGQYIFGGNGAAERSPCGNGKWCVNGACKEDNDAPKGDCLVPTLLSFCQEKSDQGYDVCATRSTGECCQFCNKQAKQIEINSDAFKNWLNQNIPFTYEFISQRPVLKCNDADWCAVNVPFWLNQDPDTCVNGVFNGQQIGESCKNACGKCV